MRLILNINIYLFIKFNNTVFTFNNTVFTLKFKQVLTNHVTGQLESTHYVTNYVFYVRM